jgi:presenilin-like A22 family membrane protease
MTVQERKNEVSIVAWFAGGTILVYLVGFIFSIPPFLFLFLKWRAKEKWLVSILVPVVVTAIVYFVFMWLLHIPLYEGVLFE